ncbi:unnamed protein product [Cuscuta europaea]|uniref:Ty3 transposon capsid-like protein domain-containing protein n=1 Tax=Cuscuta europaea TaxID=41803 RepID=A0A9P0YY19_CUSEU|nr:unnamed protein product [Cuscuta europaea]
MFSAKRFLSPSHDDIVVKFTQLVQRSDVSSYVENFEEIKSLVRAKHPAITEDFYISCFLKGLKEELRAPLQLFKPETLTMAINQAKLLENTLEIWGRKEKIAQKNAVVHFAGSRVNGPENWKNSLNTGRENSRPSVKKLTKEEYNARKEKGLCFTCNEKYTRTQMFKSVPVGFE